MKRFAVALLAIALVGAFAAPAFAQAAPPTCFGPNNRVCIGEDQSGNGFLMIKNSSGFGIYYWANPRIGTLADWKGVRAKNIHNLQMLLIAHSHAVEYGLAFPYAGDNIPNLTRQHGVQVAVTHECTTCQ